MFVTRGEEEILLSFLRTNTYSTNITIDGSNIILTLFPDQTIFATDGCVKHECYRFEEVESGDLFELPCYEGDPDLCRDGQDNEPLLFSHGAFSLVVC